MDAVRHFALQTAAKPLQIATQLIGIYQRYHRRPLTTYRLATIQNLTIDTRQRQKTTTDRY